MYLSKMQLHWYTLLCAFASISQTFAECYYPDGKVAPGLTPCNMTAEVSHCCREADVCISNGLCFSTGLSTIVRRGCTDKSFNSTVCPGFCTEESEGKLSSSDAVFTPCGSYGKFCCGQDNAARSCCDAGNDTVTIGGGDAMCNGTVTLPAGTLSSGTPTPNTTNTTEEDCADTQSLEASLGTKTTTVTGLAVALGCVGLAFAALLYDWNRKRIQLLPPGMRK